MSNATPIPGAVDKSHARAIRRGKEADWLRLRGFGGLYEVDGECGCEVDDLYPCGERAECRPGYLENCTADCEHDGFEVGGWHITSKRRDVATDAATQPPAVEPSKP